MVAEGGREDARCHGNKGEPGPVRERRLAAGSHRQRTSLFEAPGSSAQFRRLVVVAEPLMQVKHDFYLLLRAHGLEAELGEQLVAGTRPLARRQVGIERLGRGQLDEGVQAIGVKQPRDGCLGRRRRRRSTGWH